MPTRSLIASSNSLKPTSELFFPLAGANLLFPATSEIQRMANVGTEGYVKTYQTKLLPGTVPTMGHNLKVVIAGHDTLSKVSTGKAHTSGL